MSSYEIGMTVVAISITKQQWDTILGGRLDGNASRLLFASIEKESLKTCLQLEVETGLKKGERKVLLNQDYTALALVLRQSKRNGRNLGIQT